MDYLFSYGTLQLADVQAELFGGAVPGEPDALVGYRLDTVRLGDPDVVRLSGTDTHRIARPTGNASDRVPGIVLTLTHAQLARADAYETDDYERVAVRLASGREAWLYAARDEDRRAPNQRM